MVLTIPEAGPPPIVAQTLVEYGSLSGMNARLAAVQQRLEEYIGQGNTKYLLLVLLVLLIVVLAKRRR